MAPLYFLKLKTPPKLDKRGEALQAKMDLQNEILIDILLSQIFDRGVENDELKEHFIPFEESKNRKFVEFSECNVDDSTYHCDDEWTNWNNGNISEISYWDDVICDDPTTLYQQNIKDYLSLVMHNKESWNRYHATKEKMMMQKKLEIFNKAYTDLWSESLRHPWLDNSDVLLNKQDENNSSSSSIEEVKHNGNIKYSQNNYNGSLKEERLKNKQERLERALALNHPNLFNYKEENYF